MSIEIIKTLIHEFNDSDLTRLKLNYNDFQIELEKEKEVVCASTLSQVATTQMVAVSNETVATHTAVAEPACSAGTKIKSPMVGTFYTASSPTSEPFVSVGKQVKKGDIICIIEAMKWMTEVEAEVDGKIVELLVENEEMVEFD